MSPPDRSWAEGVQEIEPTDRAQQLPDGRLMHESRLTLSPEWMDQLFLGYRCIACLERQDEAFPEVCRAPWCGFPMKAEQMRRLEQDFVEQHPPTVSGFPLERELEHLERTHHKKRPM